MTRRLAHIVLFAVLALVKAMAQEKYYADREGALRLYQNGEESLAISRRGRSFVLTSVAGGSAIRRLYDDMGRLKRREVWSTINKSCLKDEEYSYIGDFAKPASCVAREAALDKSRIITEKRYDSEGHVIEEKQWRIDAADEKDAGKTAGESRHLIKVVTRKYDASRVAEVTTVTRGEDGGKQTVREVYKGDDAYRYENGVLRLSTVHKGKDDYTTTVVFGEGEDTIKIMTDYKDGRKVGTKVIK